VCRILAPASARPTRPAASRTRREHRTIGDHADRARRPGVADTTPLSDGARGRARGGRAHRHNARTRRRGHVPDRLRVGRLGREARSRSSWPRGWWRRFEISRTSARNPLAGALRAWGWTPRPAGAAAGPRCGTRWSCRSGPASPCSPSHSRGRRGMRTRHIARRCATGAASSLSRLLQESSISALSRRPSSVGPPDRQPGHRSSRTRMIRFGPRRPSVSTVTPGSSRSARCLLSKSANRGAVRRAARSSKGSAKGAIRRSR
jgi:hypothetical protein